MMRIRYPLLECEPRPIKRAGWTLVELLIVIVVLGIVAQVGVSGLSGRSRMLLPAVGQAIASDLRTAAGSAISQNGSYMITFDLTNNCYTVQYTGTASVPALVTLSPTTSKTSTSYTASITAMDGSGDPTARIRLLAVRLKGTSTAVTQITLQPQGGTGPDRAVDTEVWLTAGSGSRQSYVRLTVSWLTGQVWIDQPATYQ